MQMVIEEIKEMRESNVVYKNIHAFYSTIFLNIPLVFSKKIHYKSDSNAVAMYLNQCGNLSNFGAVRVI
jgi:hypothetical protein